MHVVTLDRPEDINIALADVADRHPIRTNFLRTLLWPGETIPAILVCSSPVQSLDPGIIAPAVVGAAILPGALFLSPMASGAAHHLADHLAAQQSPAPHAPLVILGPPLEATSMAGRLSEHRQSSYEVTETQRVYEYLPDDDDGSPAPVVGRAEPLRKPDPEEIDRTAVWCMAMSTEIGEAFDEEIYRHRVRRRIDHDQFWTWQVDGRPVSQLFRSRNAHGTVRIGGVYTPPEHRGHGYAAALTAAVTRNAHGAGARVLLNTQAANALTNRLYRRIGFRAVGEQLSISVAGS